MQKINKLSESRYILELYFLGNVTITFECRCLEEALLLLNFSDSKYCSNLVRYRLIDNCAISFKEYKNVYDSLYRKCKYSDFSLYYQYLMKYIMFRKEVSI